MDVIDKGVRARLTRVNMITVDFAEITKNLVGQTLILGGFVHSIRDHGGLVFIDLRSQTKVIQCVINPQLNSEVFTISQGLHPEYVLRISGTVHARDEESINPNLDTGEIEILVDTLEVISVAKTLPFNIHSETELANEELRLKYRYLDLRRDRLKNLLTIRSRMILDVRNWFANLDFVDITTPVIANASPEGARDFLIPSRIQPGKFYALPQSPQQFKQLLMVGGFNKYIQISQCFRDEDPRADRLYGGFTQIDAEIAWAEPSDIKELCWNLINQVFIKYTDKKLAPEFKTIEYAAAIEKYGSDKPDLRYDLSWVNVKETFVGSYFAAFASLCNDSEARVQALVVRGGASRFSRSDLDKIQDIGRSFGLPGIAYIQYQEDGAKSPIFKFFGEQEEQKKQDIASTLQTESGDLVLFIANSNKNIVHKAQNAMRSYIARHLGLIDETVMQFVWVDNMPFFEEGDNGELAFGHNPFSVWEGGLETLLATKARGTQALLELKAKQYDITVNGYEVLSGGVRNQDPESLKEVFRLCGYSDEEVSAKFGHMIEAYSYGAPIHAGFAWGVERLFMVLQGEDNVREVDAFPMNGSGINPMMDSPSTVRESQLKELHIKIIE